MAIPTPSLYVSCIEFGRDDVSYVIALDPNNLSVRGHVTLTRGRGARLAMRPDGHRLWVSHQATNLISVLNADTLEIEGDPIDLDGNTRPYQMAVRAHGSTFYPKLILACQHVDKIYVYDMHSRQRESEIDVETVRENQSASIGYVKLHPNNHLLYTYSQAYPQTRDYIIVFDIGDDRNIDDATKVAEICFEGDCVRAPDISFELQESVFNPEGTRLYIANRSSVRIEVIDTIANVYLDPIVIENYRGPRSLAISPCGTYLYIGYINQRNLENPNEELPGYLVMFNLENETVIQVEPIPGNPRTMILNPDGDRLFIAEHEAQEIYAFDIDISREHPMALYAKVDLGTVVDSGEAMPVEVLYLERRYLMRQFYSTILEIIKRFFDWFMGKRF